MTAKEVKRPARGCEAGAGVRWERARGSEARRRPSIKILGPYCTGRRMNATEERRPARGCEAGLWPPAIQQAGRAIESVTNQGGGGVRFPTDPIEML